MLRRRDPHAPQRFVGSGDDTLVVRAEISCAADKRRPIRLCEELGDGCLAVAGGTSNHEMPRTLVDGQGRSEHLLDVVGHVTQEQSPSGLTGRHRHRQVGDDLVQRHRRHVAAASFIEVDVAVADQRSPGMCTQAALDVLGR